MKISDFFNSSNKRTATIQKNIVWGAGIKGISIITSLLLVPLTIDYVSSELYGIWLTLSSIIGWLSFFDVGFGLGLRNRLTTSIALGENAKGKIYVSTTYFILSFIFLIVGLAGWWGAAYIDWCALLKINSSYGELLITSSRIVIVSFCFSIVLKIIQNVFQAFQMTAAASLLDTIGQILSLFFIYILTKTTLPNLNYLAIVFCFTPLVVFIVASLIMYCGRFSEVSPSIRSIELRYAASLFNLGGKFFLIQIIVIILYQATNFIISHFCGPEQVTVYNIAYKYLNCALMVFNIIMAPLWSAYNDAYARKDYGWMKTIYRKLFISNSIIIVGIVLLILVSPIVYRIWVGDSVHVPFVVSVLVGIYMIMQSISNMHAAILNGMGLIKLQIIQALLQGLIYIPLVYVLAQHISLYGILISLTFVAIIPAIILPIQVNLIVNQKANGIWNK